MEEVYPIIVRAIGNWDIDTLGEVYSTKMTLPEMRVLAGRDSRHCHYRNPRTILKGNDKHKELAKHFFP